MVEKAAVVIGVDKTGGLPKLKSAALGAEAVAEWLRKEGYDVSCYTDRHKQPVIARDIEDAIVAFASEPPRYDLLVVYFSGHGYWHARSDLWLLSNAPTRTSQAINLRGAMDLAVYSGIPNVVFISDACRTIPDKHTGALVKGIDAFPNHENIDSQSKIDVFKATSKAHSAYECQIDGEPHSVLTYALMSAYEQPEQEMVHSIIVDGAPINIVPNRKLEDYLQNKVNDILAGIDINLSQNIEAVVPSSDDTYIARARIPIVAMSAPPLESDSASKSPRSEIAVAIERTLTEKPDGNDSLDSWVASSTDTTEKLQLLMPSIEDDRMESAEGFIVQGARVSNVVSANGNSSANAELLDPGDNGSAVVRLSGVNPAVSVAIELEDGRCAVLAGLNGYIGHARFDDQGLTNVSYIPSANNSRWQHYADRKDAIDRLRALVALAVENNTFQIRSAEEGEVLAERIRTEKGVDPTLGLYAAHAYSQASDDGGVSSVLSYMLDDLQAHLYDVWLLASRNPQRTLHDYQLAPFCPMLTQTWNLHRPRGISLHPVLEAATPYLCDSLWTTFGPEAGASIMQVMATGELQ